MRVTSAKCGRLDRSVISVKEKVSLGSDYSNSERDCTRGENVTSTAITTSSTTVVVDKNI